MKAKSIYQQSEGSSPRKSTQRFFSEELKKRKVKEIEQGLIGVTDLSRSLDVSRSSIYKWLQKYSLTYTKTEKVIVESKSESKKVLLLQERIKELERIVEQKQLRLEFVEKMLELASEELGTDLKKKFSTRPSSGIGTEEKKKASK